MITFILIVFTINAVVIIINIIIVIRLFIIIVIITVIIVIEIIISARLGRWSCGHPWVMGWIDK